MVLSALLALGVLFDKRKIYFQGANDDSYKIIEIIASWILCIEQLLMAIYEFIQCNNLNTNRCLVSVQYFQVGLILLIIISETLYSKRCLYLLFRLWIIIYNIYSLLFLISYKFADPLRKISERVFFIYFYFI